MAEQVVDGRLMEVFDRSPRTLVEAFMATREHGDAEALIYGDERWTYAEQMRLAMSCAEQFRDRFGVTPGGRVAIAMRNYPEWAIVFWAVQLLGGVVVPLNAWLTGRELATLLVDSEPIVLVADQERVDRLGAEQGVLALSHVVVVRGQRPFTVPFAELVPTAHGEVEPYPATPDQVATILYTSGTTGAPKGVIGTHRNHTSTILSMRLRAEAVRRARQSGGGGTPGQGATLITTPLFHIAALTALTSNAYAGRRAVLMYRWDVDEAVRLIDLEGVTEMSGPPLVLRQLVDHAIENEHDLSSLISLVSGAAPAPPQLIRDIARNFGGRVSPGTGYGSTETTSAVITITGTDFRERPTSVGRPLPTVEIRVQDGSGNAVAVGDRGELEVRGPQVTPGYIGSSGDSSAFSDGWYRTGDQVILDEDGFVYLVGRLKDIIIRSGENVYCGEVERSLEDHPDVLEAAVIGLPHPIWGEEVTALVRLRAGRSLDPADLTRFLSDGLAAFKIPTTIRFTEEALPRTATGKLIKADVKRMAA